MDSLTPKIMILEALLTRIAKNRQYLALQELTRLTEEAGLYEWQCKRCKGTGKEPI